MKYAVGEKIKSDFMLEKVFSCVNRFDYGSYFVYIMTDPDGDTFVWRTGKEIKDANGEAVGKKAKFTLEGTVKENSTYKNKPQTILTRCKVVDVEYNGVTEEEYREILKNEQARNIEALGWETERVSYREYKDLYSDCETVIDSFERTPNGCFIEIIKK